MRGLLANAHRIPDRRCRSARRCSGSIGIEVIAAIRRPAAAPGAAAIVRQHRSAPAGLVGRKPQAEAVENLAGAPASSGCSENRRWPISLKGLFKLALIGAVLTLLLWPERTGSTPWSRSIRSSILPATRIFSLKMLGSVVAIMAFVAAADFCSSTGPGSSGRRCRCGDQGRVQADRRRSEHQGADPPLRETRMQEAHDGGGAGRLGRHHQPDPFRGRAEIRARR